MEPPPTSMNPKSQASSENGRVGERPLGVDEHKKDKTLGVANEKTFRFRNNRRHLRRMSETC